MFICPFLSHDGEDLECVLGVNFIFFFSLLVQLCGSCYTGHYHLHLLPAEVLCVLHQPACPSPSAFAVWVRQLWVEGSPGGQGIWYPLLEEGQKTPMDVCICAFPGGRSHLSCTQLPSCSRFPALPTWSSPVWTSSSASMAVWPLSYWSSLPTMWVPQTEHLQLACTPGARGWWLTLTLFHLSVTLTPLTTLLLQRLPSLVYINLFLSCYALYFSGHVFSVSFDDFFLYILLSPSGSLWQRLNSRALLSYLDIISGRCHSILRLFTAAAVSCFYLSDLCLRCFLELRSSLPSGWLHLHEFAATAH